MDTATETALHPILQTLIHLAPAIKESFFSPVTISISDRREVLYQLDSPELSELGNNVGLVLSEKDPMYNVMRTNKSMSMMIPKEHYGMAIRASIVPIIDDKGHVIGSMGISRSIKDQANLMEIAESFASSSEELTASSAELTNSAKGLFEYMKDVNESQENLAMQVMESAKILDMINNVAKNTRILGFNAGIEAARSGEHGRGFAVVAKEITKLADQSADSVNEIRNLLNRMKDMVDHVSETMTHTQELTESQVVATSEITKALEQLSVVAERIDTLAHKL